MVSGIVVKKEKKRISESFRKRTKESEETISSLVNDCESFVDKDTDEEFHPTSGVSEVSNMFNKWLVENGSDESSYKNFKVFLNGKLKEALYKYSILEIKSDFIKQKEVLINEYTSELKAFKESRSPKFRKVNSVKRDVINYLKIIDLRPNGCARLVDCKYFFITFDKLLCSWSKGISDGLPCPIVDPNVMYSLLLRFSSRTDDDVRSFNEFLSSSLLYYFDDEKALRTKGKIAKLINNYSGLSSEQKMKIHLTANSIIDRLIWSGESEIDVESVLNDSCLSAMEEFERDKNKEIELLNHQHENEIVQIKEESYKNGLKQSNERFLAQIKKEADNKTKVEIWFRRGITIFIAALAICSICFFIVFLNKMRHENKEIYETFEFYLMVFGTLSPLILWIVNSIFTKTLNFKINLWSFDKKKIFSKKYKKLCKKYDIDASND